MELRSLSFVLALAIGGCTSLQPQPIVPKAVNQANQDIKEQTARIPKVVKTLVPAPLSKPAIVENRFDIAVNDVPAKLFFFNLMAGAKRNIVVHPDVDGTISLQLSQVTLDEVLEVIRDIYGYDFRERNNIYTIYASKLRTETFPVNYINVKRVGVSDTSVLTGNIESSSQSSSAGSSQETDLVGSGNAISPGARVQTHTEADFWLSMEKAVSELIGLNRESEDESRKVIVNPQAGAIIVTALPHELAAVRDFIERAQLTIEKQVIIEAKILEIELSKAFEAGINWDQINGQLLLANNVAEFSSPTSIVTAAEGVGEVFSSLIKVADITQLLSLLQTQGSVQVLSSPRVSTVNNQKAVIRVGNDRFFVTGVSNSTTTSSGSTTNNPDVELSSFFSGISLDVTPQISDNDEIILHIHPVISTVTEELKELTVGDNAFSLPLALRDIRESDSIVRAESGQIIVLGGLMQEKDANLDGNRPGISKIPLFGNLFKSKSQQQVKSELIILLKPQVVSNKLWEREISQSDQRIQQWVEKTEIRVESEESDSQGE